MYTEEKFVGIYQMITVAFLGRCQLLADWISVVVVHLLWTSIFIVILENEWNGQFRKRKYVLERHQRLTKSIETSNSDSSNQPVGTEPNFHGDEERSPSWHVLPGEGVLSWPSTAPGLSSVLALGWKALFQIPRWEPLRLNLPAHQNHIQWRRRDSWRQLKNC